MKLITDKKNVGVTTETDVIPQTTPIISKSIIETETVINYIIIITNNAILSTGMIENIRQIINQFSFNDTPRTSLNNYISTVSIVTQNY